MDELITTISENNRKYPNLPLLMCFSTHLEFEGEAFDINFCNTRIKISKDTDNYTSIGLKNQQVPYKATILGGFALTEDVTGSIDYRKYFNIAWKDEQAIPEMVFLSQPAQIVRNYFKGQKIEFGIEDISRYHVHYRDGVTADFTRTGDAIYDFTFSTGLTGSFKKEEDGVHSIRFKGIPVDEEDDGYKSESKLIISRSKYTDNLVLILQDTATVYIYP